MGTLRLAASVRGVVAALHLGGVGELLVNGLGSAVHQFISLGGQSLGSSQSVGSALETAESGVQLGVAQEAALGISGCNGFGERGLHCST